MDHHDTLDDHLEHNHFLTMPPRTLLALLILLSAGCSSTDTNKSILSPSTWFSDAPLKKVERNDRKTEEARDVALKRIQILTLEQAIGLTYLPPSEGLNHVIHSNKQGLHLLSQLAGPVSPTSQAEVEGYMGLLFSGDASHVKKGLSAREDRDGDVADASDTLEALRKERDSLTDKLKEGFARENSLANAHRTAWATFYWVAGVLGVLFILHTVLPILAPIFPVLGGLSKMVTSITSPGLTYVESRKSKMIPALAEMIRDEPEETRGQLIERLDRYLDTDHKRSIRKAKKRLDNDDKM